MTVRAPKKSETLEIRLPHASKVAFMEQCRRNGVTASEVLRNLIEKSGGTACKSAGRGLSRWMQVLAAAGTGLLIGSVAAPAIAQALPERASFTHLDLNHDGVLTRSEFEKR